MPERPDLNLLFVCTGNTCRSPMAHVLAEHMFAEAGWDGVQVRSAGISAMPGSSASQGAVQAVAEADLDLSGHRSTPLDRELVEWADLVLTMGSHHLMAVHSLGGEGKTAMLSAFADGQDDGQGWGVPDPFGGDLEVYRDSFLVLAELVNAVVDRLSRESETPTGNEP